MNQDESDKALWGISSTMLSNKAHLWKTSPGGGMMSACGIWTGFRTVEIAFDGDKRCKRCEAKA
jgi:hypothetical protein